MTSPRPNLLWVFCDQLRASALACNGDANARTPNLDRLAAQGANFSLGVSQYPICSPFRAGLLTGQYAHVNGLRVHGDLLPPDRVTAAHAFRNAGYRTSWFGKWHLASVQGVTGWKDGADFWVHPHLRGGFEDWCGFDSSNHYYNTRYSRGTQIWPPIKLEGYQTDALTDLSLEYLDATARPLARAGTPFFHVLSLESPHPGCDEHGVYRFPAPPEYARRYTPDAIKLRPNVLPHLQAEAREKLAGYYAMLENLDANVGRILTWLEESGLADDTLVAFFSDHGELGGSHGLFEKSEVYDESIRIPVLMRLPGAIPGGTRVVTPISGVDIYPTCAALCNVPIPPPPASTAPVGVQGLDLAPLARGEPGAGARDAALIQWLGPALQGFGEFRYRAIRTATHTYSVCDDPARCVLFDNVADPFQLRNLFDDPSAGAIKGGLHARLIKEIESSAEPVPDFVRVPASSKPR